MSARCHIAAAGLLGIALSAAPAGEAAAKTYQKTVEAVVCDVGQCNVVFPKIGSNKELRILFVSCSTRGTNLEVGEALLGIDNAFQPPNLYLTGTARSAGGTDFFIVSQPVVFTIPSAKKPNIKIFFDETTGSPAATCSISGDLVTLP